MNSMRSCPKRDNRWLIIPVSFARKRRTMEQITTTERKWGAYEIICTTFLNFILVISFKVRAKIIEQGNVAREYNPMEAVFHKINQKFGNVMKRLKCWNPIQRLPQIPKSGLKSLKAICTPYIGIYLKMNTYTNAGIRRT